MSREKWWRSCWPERRARFESVRVQGRFKNGARSVPLRSTSAATLRLGPFRITFACVAAAAWDKPRFDSSERGQPCPSEAGQKQKRRGQGCPRSSCDVQSVGGKDHALRREPLRGDRPLSRDTRSINSAFRWWGRSFLSMITTKDPRGEIEMKSGWGTT